MYSPLPPLRRLSFPSIPKGKQLLHNLYSELQVKQALNRIRNRTNGSLVELSELYNELPDMQPALIEVILTRMEAENMIMLSRKENRIILI
jgi:hypothetical protein